MKHEINKTKDLTEREQLYTLILNHVVDRDKRNLLFEREPIPRRKAKLLFLEQQIAQSQKDRGEYLREIKVLDIMAWGVVEKFDSDFQNDR